MHSVPSSDTDGEDSLFFLIENECWRFPGWNGDLAKPQYISPWHTIRTATGYALQAQTSSLFSVYLLVQGGHYHSSLYFCAEKL